MDNNTYFLKAGPIEVRYEKGFLRYFKFAGAEVLRMVYFAIRDHNWLTMPIRITNEVIHQDIDSFQVSYDWETDHSGIHMAGRLTMEGDQYGAVTIAFYGKAYNSFRKNRLGLCILHPIEGVLGQPVALITPEGNLSSSHFPTLISPYQPFLNIETMRWQPVSGATWQLDFFGDIFETEDQRNWSDASFKTYSTPLDKPFPVTVRAGETFSQKVVFSRSNVALRKPVTVIEAPENPPLSSKTKQAFPAIGVGQRTGGPCLTAREAAFLQKLGLSHLRADVFFSQANWQTLLANAIADAEALMIPVELAVFFGDSPVDELNTLQYFFEANPAALRSMMLFHADTLTTTDKLLETVVPVVRACWPGLPIGGGTDRNFAELNRNRLNVNLVDFLTYSINPQVHAYDDLTLLENLAGQAETVFSAQQLSGGKPVYISLVTLRPRFTTLAGAATERMAPAIDPRQNTRFGADWTQQSMHALARAGVESITYYQSHGPAGLVHADKLSPVYTVFESRERIFYQ